MSIGRNQDYNLYGCSGWPVIYVSVFESETSRSIVSCTLTKTASLGWIRWIGCLWVRIYISHSDFIIRIWLWCTIISCNKIHTKDGAKLKKGMGTVGLKLLTTVEDVTACHLSLQFSMICITPISSSYYMSVIRYRNIGRSVKIEVAYRLSFFRRKFIHGPDDSV